jgi:hypothetical protein
MVHKFRLILNKINKGVYCLNKKTEQRNLNKLIIFSKYVPK